MTPQTDIFIVSCRKHFNHLKYALRSIKKFASGFRRTLVIVPLCDMTEARKLLGDGPDNMELIDFNEWQDKGMVHHFYIIMCSDEYSPADYILHFDSDCVFTEPVTPEDYFVDGKPVLMYADFEWLCTTQQANLRMWQDATINAIGKPIDIETMRRHPAVHHRELYHLARQAVEHHTQQPVMTYIRNQKNEYPQTFCEFVTLGNVAWRYMKDDYHWRDQQSQGFPHSKLHQNWSHCEPTDENIALYKKLGIY
jgi:uncharacterized protein DUF6492